MTPMTAKNIVAMVSRDTGVKLEFVRCESCYDPIAAKDERGRRYLIVIYPGGLSGSVVVKSLLRQKRRGSGMSYLCNGQASRNAVEVAFWDESHRYKLSASEFVAENDGPKRMRYLLDKNAITIPEHLTEDEIRSAIATLTESEVTT